MVRWRSSTASPSSSPSTNRRMRTSEAEHIFYNTAAVIGRDGTFLGKYRKGHIPHCAPGFWEKFYFKPGNIGSPVFNPGFNKVGVYICYDRHFPEGGRVWAQGRGDPLQSERDRRRPLRVSRSSSSPPRRSPTYTCRRDQPRRDGAAWCFGEFFGQSYFGDPRGKLIGGGPRDKEYRRRRSRSRSHRRGPRDLAVLSRPQAGPVRRSG